MTAKRAPEAPEGLEWVVMCCSAPVRPCTHPPGPVGTLRAPPWYRTSLPENTRLWANKGENTVILL